MAELEYYHRRRPKKQTYTLEDDIMKRQSEAVSDDQISYALRGDVSIIVYQDLIQHQDIRNIFQKSNNVVLLLPVESATSGHYITLIYYPSMNHIVVFDSYGLTIQMDIKRAIFLKNYDQRIQQRLPDLLNTFIKSGGTVDINDIEVQADRSAIATCGKWAVMRILYRDIVSNDEFVKFLKFRTLTPDEIVTLMFL